MLISSIGSVFSSCYNKFFIIFQLFIYSICHLKCPLLGNGFLSVCLISIILCTLFYCYCLNVYSMKYMCVRCHFFRNGQKKKKKKSNKLYIHFGQKQSVNQMQTESASQFGFDYFFCCFELNVYIL